MSLISEMIKEEHACHCSFNPNSSLVAHI